ncbi:hypothetical protein BD769DRAFT_1643139 [Suillus cothurnatus]|nr:hypothetical protein BD769DRAFT_1643139 [Suillus cothurnatus]
MQYGLLACTLYKMVNEKDQSGATREAPQILTLLPSYPVTHFASLSVSSTVCFNAPPANITGFKSSADRITFLLPHTQDFVRPLMSIQGDTRLSSLTGCWHGKITSKLEIVSTNCLIVETNPSCPPVSHTESQTRVNKDSGLENVSDDGPTCGSRVYVSGWASLMDCPYEDAGEILVWEFCEGKERRTYGARRGHQSLVVIRVSVRDPASAHRLTRNLSLPNTSPPSTYINSSSTILASPNTRSSAYSRTHTYQYLLHKHNHLHKCELSRTVGAYTFLLLALIILIRMCATAIFGVFFWYSVFLLQSNLNVDLVNHDTNDLSSDSCTR